MKTDTELSDHIIDYIKRNRVSSVETADALKKQGVLHGLQAYNSGHFAVGLVHYVYTHSKSNWSLHEQIQEAPANCILYVDAFECEDRAVLGSIMAKYVFLYKQIKGLVINGYARDAHHLRKENYPIWLKGVTPLGCENNNIDATTDIVAAAAAKKDQLEGGIMVCDDSGCTLIAKEQITQETLDRLAFIEAQEDIWEFCVNTLKWSTYETICLKRYLQETNVVPDILRKELEKHS